MCSIHCKIEQFRVSASPNPHAWRDHEFNTWKSYGKTHEKSGCLPSKQNSISAHSLCTSLPMTRGIRWSCVNSREEAWSVLLLRINSACAFFQFVIVTSFSNSRKARCSFPGLTLGGMTSRCFGGEKTKYRYHPTKSRHSISNTYQGRRDPILLWSDWRELVLDFSTRKIWKGHR